jgi:hypothetical protein
MRKRSRFTLIILCFLTCVRSDAVIPESPPLSQFVSRLLDVFFCRYQETGKDRYLDATVYMVLDGIPLDNLPPVVSRTNFHYLEQSAIDEQATQRASDSKEFVYFVLRPGKPTREGWRTLYLTIRSVSKTSPSLKHRSEGAYGFAEVPIEGEFVPVGIYAVIID